MIAPQKEDIPTVNDLVTPEIIDQIIHGLYLRYSFLRRENLVSYVYFGIIKALETYQPEKGFPLKGWVFMKASFDTIDQLRAEKQLNRKGQGESRKRYVYIEDMSDSDIRDVFMKIEEHDDFADIDNADTCDFLLEQLDEREAEVVRRRYFKYETLVAIGNTFGGKRCKRLPDLTTEDSAKKPLSESAVSQIHKAAILRLRYLKDEAGFDEPMPEDKNIILGDKIIRMDKL